MLVRLMYASRAADSMNADELAAILKKSKEHNAAEGVTGVLCFCFNANIFLQVLEGGRELFWIFEAKRRYVCEDRMFPEVVLDHCGHIGVNELVVCDAVADRVCDRDISRASGIHDASAPDK